MRRIDQESRATLQPPRSQDIQLRPLTPVNRVIPSFVEQTNIFLLQGKYNPHSDTWVNDQDKPKKRRKLARLQADPLPPLVISYHFMYFGSLNTKETFTSL